MGISAIKPRAFAHWERRLGFGSRLEIQSAQMAKHALHMARQACLLLDGNPLALERKLAGLEARIQFLQVDRAAELQKVERFIQESPIGFHILSPEGRIKYVNEAWLKTLEYSREEVMGRSIFEFIPDVPEQRGNAMIRFEERKRGVPEESLTPKPVYRQYRKKDGSIIYAVTKDTFFRDADGKVTEVLTSFQDVTAQIEAEREAFEARQREILKARYTAIGEVAAAMSHSLNNLLTGARGNVEAIRSLYLKVEALLQIIRASERIGRPIEEERHERLFEMIREIGRLICTLDKSVGAMGETTDTMLGFATAGYERKKMVAIREAVEEVVSERGSHAAMNKVKITVDFKSVDSQDAIFINGLGLKDLLRNLIKNAIEAYANGVSRKTKREVRVTVEKLGNRGTIMILVRDEGMGMTPERQEELRRAGEGKSFVNSYKRGGNGIGIICVKRVAASAKGKLQILSKLGQGTTMVVSFPARRIEEERVSEAGRTTQAPAPQSYDVGGILVMLVEDDAAVRQFIGILLESMGFQVVAFTNPIESLQMYRQMSARPPIVVTDLRMDQMSGQRLIEEMTAVSGAKKPHFIICSGNSGLKEDADFSSFLRKHDASFITKPISRPDFERLLAEKAGEILGRDTAAGSPQELARQTPFVRFLGGLADIVNGRLSEFTSWVALCYQGGNFNLSFQGNLEDSRNSLLFVIRQIEAFAQRAASEPLSLGGERSAISETWQAMAQDQRYKLAILADIYLRAGLLELGRLLEGDLTGKTAKDLERLEKTSKRIEALAKAARLLDDAPPLLAQRARECYQLLESEF